MKAKRVLGAATAAVLGISGVAFLATVPTSAQSPQTATLGVSANVNNNCTITTTPATFGVAYDPVGAHLAANLDGAGSVIVACTKGTSATIGLDPGGSFSGGTRRMTDGTDFLAYELYQPSGFTTVWNTTTGLLSPAAAPSKAPRTFTVNARIPMNQDVTAGSYADSVLASVNF
jgi:spore coat protein U-like protein